MKSLQFGVSVSLVKRVPVQSPTSLVESPGNDPGTSRDLNVNILFLTPEIAIKAIFV